MTIICESRGFAFYHIPKTGGCAIAWGLAKVIPEFPDPPPAEEIFGVESHKKWHKYGGWPNKYHTRYGNHVLHPPFHANKFKGLFIFSFYRNPFDRALSLFYWGGYKNFSGFASRLGHIGNAAQQINFCHPSTLSFAGRFENLNEDFKKICVKLGLDTIDLPIVNKNPKSSPGQYREMYDEETKRVVSEFYADDIDTLGYQF